MLEPTAELSRPAIVRRRFVVNHFDGALGTLLITLTFADLILASLVQLTGQQQLLLSPWLWARFALMALLCAYCCLRPLPRLVDAARLTMWGAMLWTPIAILFQVVARVHIGLADARLAAIDRRMHFDTAWCTHAATHLPLVAGCFMVAYCLYGPMIVSAMTIPAVCGSGEASRRFFISMLFGLLLGLVISALVPAAGPWTTEAIRPYQSQAGVGLYLQQLKSGIPLAIDMEHSGIVSFPSMHVVFAILSAQALCTVRRLRIPALVMCISVCLSTVATGWHYGIDVLGGIAVAFVAGVMGKKLTSTLDQWNIRTEFAPEDEPLTRFLNNNGSGNISAAIVVHPRTWNQVPRT